LSELGRKSRLGRIFDYSSKTTIIVPMDHAVEEHFPQLKDPRRVIRSLTDSGVNAFLLRRGLARFAADEFIGRCGFVYRISSASGLRPQSKRVEQAKVSSVEEAVKLGADAVAVNIFVGSEREVQDLTTFGEISDSCDEWGIPLLAETMPIGGKEAVPFDGPYSAQDVSMAARVGAEEGADIIKTYYTGSVDSFQQVVQNCPVPLIIAGGPKTKTTLDVLRMVKSAMDAGAAGVAMGRKIWGAEDPAKLVQALRKIVRDKASVEDASASLS